MLKASLPRWCATSPMARHTWPVRVAAIPLHATTIRETHCIAATHIPLHAIPRWKPRQRFGVLAFWHPIRPAHGSAIPLQRLCR